MPQTHMQRALTEAKKAFKKNEVPVGSVIVDHNTDTIVAASSNCIESNHNPLAHAEMNVLQQASMIKGSTHLTDCDLYVTLEPCPMCAHAISLARIRRLYFGAYDRKSGGVEHGPRIFESSSCHHKPEIYGGIFEKEAAELMQSFFRERR